MAQVIIITGYIDGNEVSRIWNHDDEKEKLINKVIEGIEYNGRCYLITDTINNLIESEIIGTGDAESFLHLLPHIDDDYPEKITDIKIVNWDVVNNYYLPS